VTRWDILIRIVQLDEKNTRRETRGTMPIQLKMDVETPPGQGAETGQRQGVCIGEKEDVLQRHPDRA
jgi:hypothetical protein